MEIRPPLQIIGHDPELVLLIVVINLKWLPLAHIFMLLANYAPNFSVALEELPNLLCGIDLL